MCFPIYTLKNTLLNPSRLQITYLSSVRALANCHQRIAVSSQAFLKNGSRGRSARLTNSAHGCDELAVSEMRADSGAFSIDTSG